VSIIAALKENGGDIVWGRR